MITKLLIANRGEIACQVAATCRKLGIRTVAVYSDANANARHVATCDEAIHIGEPVARDSYLRVDRILEAVHVTGARAVHPDYDFLLEDEAFTEACTDAGIISIDPPASVIEAMSGKSAAKALMETAGVSLVPSCHGGSQDVTLLHTQVDRIGHPVFIKVSADGEGKGIHMVESGNAFGASLASVERETSSSFGDDRVLIGKYLTRSRHIEIQMFTDSFGDTVYLSERDCSVQRRYQEVSEEAPAPGMVLDCRHTVGEAAVAATRTVDYVGVGTVELIVNEDGTFYFMGMNTRLQIEHPVTEMIAGEDPVEWQLRVASGEPLPCTQDELYIHGHTLKVRTYAENPDRDLLPSIGALKVLRAPVVVESTVDAQTNGESAVVRIDAGVHKGDTISPYYDPMIARLTVWGRDREEALARMLQVLGNSHLVGLSSNVTLLHHLVVPGSFTTADLDTDLITRSHDTLFPTAPDVPLDAVISAVAALLVHGARSLRIDTCDLYSPWAHGSDWRLNSAAECTLRLMHGNQSINATFIYGCYGSRLKVDGSKAPFISQRHAETFTIMLGMYRATGRVHADSDASHVFTGDAHWTLECRDPFVHAGGADDEGGKLTVPMPGKVIIALVAPRQTVTKGASLVVMKATGMEHMLTAPTNDVVKPVLYGVGDRMMEGAQLLAFKPAE